MFPKRNHHGNHPLRYFKCFSRPIHVFDPVLQLLFSNRRSGISKARQETPRCLRKRLPSRFMIWRNSRVNVFDARIARLVEFVPGILSPTRHCKRIGHNAVVLMCLCKSPATPRGITPTRYSFRRNVTKLIPFICFALAC